MTRCPPTLLIEHFNGYPQTYSNPYFASPMQIFNFVVAHGIIHMVDAKHSAFYWSDYATKNHEWYQKEDYTIYTNIPSEFEYGLWFIQIDNWLHCLQEDRGTNIAWALLEKWHLYYDDSKRQMELLGALKHLRRCGLAIMSTTPKGMGTNRAYKGALPVVEKADKVITYCARILKPTEEMNGNGIEGLYGFSQEVVFQINSFCEKKNYPWECVLRDDWKECWRNL